METVIEKLIPIFILAIIGFAAGKLRILPTNTSDALCAFLFYFSAPAVSFANIVTSDLNSIFNLRFAIALTVFELSVFLLLFLLYRMVFGFSKSESVIHSVCSFYGNISYVGIPVFLTLFNNVIPNIITILVHGVLTFPLAVFLLDLFSGSGSGKGAAHAIMSAVKNPNIFVPVIGALFLLLKVPVPKLVIDTAELLGKPTTAAGMFALGLTCAQSNELITSPKLFFNALFSAAVKLVVCPFFAWIIGKYVFSLDTWWLNSLVIMAMLPAALNTYILSQRYHADETYASISVLMSNLLFSVTISLYIIVIGL